ncbi:MAG: 4Fe-4S binding protein [Eubacterium sp.]
MKKVVITDQSLCMACLSCEIACAEAFYKEPDTEKSCIKIVLKEDRTIKTKTCVQCGKCAKACEEKAITKNAKGVYMINKKLCVGCLKCVDACPFGLIVKAEEKESPTKCIACGICVKACPVEILEIKES